MNSFFRVFCIIDMSSSVDDQIRQTLVSIQRTAAHTEEVSSATAALVDSQGEQIGNAARNADKVEENLNTSQWLIRGLSSWKGRLANVFSAPQKTQESTPVYPIYMPKDSVSKPAVRQVSSNSPNFTGLDQEIDVGLDRISGALGNIKARSLQLNESINRQIKTVETVEESVDKSKQRMNQQHSVIKTLRYKT